MYYSSVINFNLKVKVKVQLSLCLTKYHFMKMILFLNTPGQVDVWVSGVIAPGVLNLDSRRSCVRFNLLVLIKFMSVIPRYLLQVTNGAWLDFSP